VADERAQDTVLNSIEEALSDDSAFKPRAVVVLGTLLHQINVSDDIMKGKVVLNIVHTDAKTWVQKQEKEE
jgi:hypothetical protein